MIPFPRIMKYGNRAVYVPRAKKIQTPYTINGSIILILYDNGELWGMSSSSNSSGYVYGLGSTSIARPTWTLIKSNVKNFSCIYYSSIIIQYNDRTFEYCGDKTFLGTTTTSANWATAYTSCTSLFAALGDTVIDDIVDFKTNGTQLYVVTASGTMYRSGTTANSVLGNPSNLTALTASTITGVDKVVLSATTVWFKTKTGGIYRCGQNAVLQLGVSSPTTMSAYTLFTPDYGTTGTYELIDIGCTEFGYYVLGRNVTSNKYSLATGGKRNSGNIGDGVAGNLNISTSYAILAVSSGDTAKVLSHSGVGYTGTSIRIGNSFMSCGTQTTGRQGKGNTEYSASFIEPTPAIPTGIDGNSLLSISANISVVFNVSTQRMSYSGIKPNTSTITIQNTFLELPMPY